MQLHLLWGNCAIYSEATITRMTSGPLDQPVFPSGNLDPGDPSEWLIRMLHSYQVTLDQWGLPVECFSLLGAQTHLHSRKTTELTCSTELVTMRPTRKLL